MTRVLWIIIYLLSLQIVPTAFARLALLVVFSLLIIIQPLYALYLPILTAIVFFQTSSTSEAIDTKALLSSRLMWTFALYIVLGILLIVMSVFTVSSATLPFWDNILTHFDVLAQDNSITNHSKIGYPGVEYGVFWYLKALMLSSLSFYFSLLVTIQSVVQANVIAILASTYQMNLKSKNNLIAVVSTYIIICLR